MSADALPAQREHEHYCGGATTHHAPARRTTSSAGASASAAAAVSCVHVRDVRVLLLESVVDRDEKVVVVRGRVRRNLAVDGAREHLLDQRLLEGLHLEEGALGHRVGDLLGALLADQVGDACVHDHHLDCGDPAAADPRQQPLADHAAQDAGEHGADLLLLRGRKNSIMRPTVSAASIVCSVEKTRWPDSAAWSAV